MCKIVAKRTTFASSIALLALALHRLKIMISLKSQDGFILLKACFLFTATSHCLFHHGTAILRDFLDCGIAFRAASRPIVSKRGNRRSSAIWRKRQSLIACGSKFLPVCFGEVPFRDNMVFRCGVRIDIF